jgi:hypothetical protein
LFPPALLLFETPLRIENPYTFAGWNRTRDVDCLECIDSFSVHALRVCMPFKLSIISYSYISYIDTVRRHRLSNASKTSKIHRRGGSSRYSWAVYGKQSDLGHYCERYRTSRGMRDFARFLSSSKSSTVC